MFTTGSTGNPKAVVLSHFNVLSAISNIVEFVGYDHNYHELVFNGIFMNSNRF